MTRRSIPFRAVLFSLCLFSQVVRGDAVRDSIDRGQNFLLSSIPRIFQRGEQALVALALAKGGTTVQEPRFAELVEKLATSVGTTEYKPGSADGPANYESAVMIMALGSVDAEKYRPQIAIIAKYLLSKQKEMGVWDYVERNTGDTSQSQYAILGLWEAASVGVDVTPDVWDRALEWHIRHQDVLGGFSYHPSAPSGPGRTTQSSVQHSTTVGGLASMVICRSRLPFAGRSPAAQKADIEDGEYPLLSAVVDEPAEGEEKKTERRPLQVTRDQVDESIRLGMNWITKNFTIDKPIGPALYYLYGLERLGALTKQKNFGSTDWFTSGSKYLIEKQDANGSWRMSYEPHIDTSFAVLFLSQSTKKTLQRIQISKLGEGTLVGGRGLPTGDEIPSEMLVRQKARFRQALRTPIDDVLESLSSPDSGEMDEGAAAAIEAAKPEQIVAKLGKSRSGLRKLAKHSNPVVREAGLWAMARLRDFRFAPILIDHLSDPDPGVYRAARDGLRFMSRRVETPPLPEADPTKETLAAAIADWKKWFETLNVEVDAAQEFDDGL